ERHHVQQEMDVKRSDLEQQRQRNKACREQWLMGNPAQSTPAQNVEVTALRQRIARMERELRSLEQLEATLGERERRLAGQLHAVEETVETARQKLQAESDEGPVALIFMEIPDLNPAGGGAPAPHRPQRPLPTHSRCPLGPGDGALEARRGDGALGARPGDGALGARPGDGALGARPGDGALGARRSDTSPPANPHSLSSVGGHHTPVTLVFLGFQPGGPRDIPSPLRAERVMVGVSTGQHADPLNG
ncbi:unnamed protein product, partial [Lampetra fluviatilis]